MTATEPATSGERFQPLEDYNYRHFRTKHFVADLVRTARGKGVPGATAPDFALPSTTGERVRLSALRGQPVVLHFGSAT